MAIRVNGEIVGSGSPGTFHAIAREWKSGDVVEFELPMGLRATEYKGSDQILGRTRYSLEYGPILLAAAGSERVDLPADFDPARVASFMKRVPDQPLHFELKGAPGIRVIPYWHISGETFTCFPSAPASARSNA